MLQLSSESLDSTKQLFGVGQRSIDRCTAVTDHASNFADIGSTVLATKMTVHERCGPRGTRKRSIKTRRLQRRQENVMSAKKEQRSSKSEANEDREKELGDEHAYGFEEDPATTDKIDNRRVVRERGKDGAFHVGADQMPAGTPVKQGSE
jgi:hypothetical protein